MKKLLSIILCTMLLLTVSGCGKETAKSSSADADDSPTEEAKENEASAVEEITEKNETSGYNPTSGMSLENPYIDPSSLDDTAIGWGMAPDRDDLNRPVTALSYQDEYSDCYVDFIIPTDEKVIYLTFDEGYENGYTESILDTLDAHNAKAVFFVTKPYAESSPELVRLMIDEGHIVGNHTVHHPSDGLTSYNLDYQENEVMETHNYIKDNFGYNMFLFRYPTGKFSRQSLAVVSNCGYRSVFWSFAHVDWDTANQPDENEALQKLETSIHPGAIYLLHAVSKTNTDILDEFLDFVEASGYRVGFFADTL